jgi:hypothetical protein
MQVDLEYNDLVALEEYWRKQANAYKACGFDQAMYKAIARANKFETYTEFYKQKGAVSCLE